MLAQIDAGAGLNVSAIVLFGLFIKKMVDTLRFAAGAARGEASAKSSLVTQLIAFAAGLAAVFLFSSSELGAAIEIGGATLGDTDGSTKVILGLLVASLGSTVTDVIKGIDGLQTAAAPRIIAD